MTRSYFRQNTQPANTDSTSDVPEVGLITKAINVCIPLEYFKVTVSHDDMLQSIICRLSVAYAELDKEAFGDKEEEVLVSRNERLACLVPKTGIDWLKKLAITWFPFLTASVFQPEYEEVYVVDTEYRKVERRYFVVER